MKKTIKTILASSLLVCFAGVAYAQGLYITTGPGYNFSAASTVIGYNETETSNGDESWEVVCGSFGKGFSFGLGAGYMCSDNCGIELNFSYLFGSEYEVKQTGSGYVFTDLYKGKMLRIIPAFKAVTGGEKLKGYCKFGPVIGVGGKLDIESSGSNTSSGFTYSFTGEHKYSKGVSLGMMGAAGVEMVLSDMFSIYIDINTIAQSWAPKERESTETTTSGGFTETEMETVDLENEVNDNDVGKDLREYMPFSSVGINAGIVLSFGGGSK